jgi:hypothetical protein
MYAVMEMRTNEQGVMQIVDPIFRTDNGVYAQNKIFTLAAGAVGSSVYVHTILCVNEHGQAQFGTPMYFEHIPQPEPVTEG